MDLLSNPEFLDMLMNRKDPASISNASDRVLQNIELPKEINNEQFKPEGPSIFWKGLPVAANLADALTVMQTRANATRADGSKISTEANPVMRGAVDKPGMLLPIKLATGLGSSLLADWVGKKTGNKTVAKILSGLAAVPPSIGTYSNLRRTSQLKRDKQR